MQDDADRIVDLYDRHALNWDKARGKKLIEQAWLDRFLSLSRDEYRARLDREGFEVVSFAAEDPDCGGHTVWLTQLR